MTIYIDIVLIENIIMNYIILFATAIVLKIKIKHIRIFIASLLGAIYSVITYMGILKLYSSIVMKILLSILIVYIAFNPQSLKKMWKNLLIFYLTSFVFGGVAFALIYILKPQDILMKNGLFLGTYPLKTVLLGAIISFLVILVAFKIIKDKFSKKDLFCDLEIKINNKIVKTTAMIDTGNCLKDPITNNPVVVIEHTLLYECIPKQILNNLDNIIGGDFEGIPQEIKETYISKLKLIPYSSLGKQNGILLGIKPEYVKVSTEENERIINAIIGIYNKSLTKRGEYRALIGVECSDSSHLFALPKAQFFSKFI